jgi:hypothetical protein
MRVTRRFGTTMVVGLLLVGAADAAEHGACNPPGYDRSAALGGGMTVDWTIRDGELHLRATAPTLGWLALGWGTQTANGHLAYDVIQAGVVSGTPAAIDAFQNAFAAPTPDDQIAGCSQQPVLVGGSEAGGSTTMLLRRPLIASDACDQPIPQGPSSTKWAFNDSSDVFSNPHAANRGFSTIEWVPIGHLFGDGFESGDLCGWSAAVGP